jgi:citrate lyase synthetase
LISKIGIAICGGVSDIFSGEIYFIASAYFPNYFLNRYLKNCTP